MKYLFISFIILFSTAVQAQESSALQSKYNLGFGFGIDYGGIGMRGTFLPNPHLGLFAAAGYNLNSVGLNAGAQWLIPIHNNNFYFIGMYGYNAVMAVSGVINDKATYYGISAGVGYQASTRSGNNFWNFELLLPFRDSNYQHDLDALKSIGASLKEPYPVAISIGYHIRF